MHTQFIKIGKRFINLAQVTHIQPRFDGRIEINFSCGYGYSDDYDADQFGVSFEGEEAAALTHYLEHASSDLVDKYHNYLAAEDQAGRL